jgi:uncharacterized protein (DUF433 family)
MKVEAQMKVDDLIHSDPAILCGKPVVRGTRLSLEFLLELLSLGWTDRQILDNHPRLTPDGLRAVRARAGESSRGRSGLG